jgi:hypothetical protein
MWLSCRMKILPSMRIVAISLIMLLLTVAAPRLAVAQLQSWPVAEITPDPLIFPDTRVGQTAATQTLTVTNTSSLIPMYIFSARLADSVHFGIVADGCSGAALAPLSSCEIDVAFTPTTANFFTTSLSIVDTGRHIVDSVTVEGRGVLPAVTLSAASVDFGDHEVGRPPEVRAVILTNTGSIALAIASIAAGGVFSVAHDCGAMLDPAASCTLLIGFAPAAEQAYAGAVTITDDAADSPQSIALQGNGVAPGQPDVGLSTASVDFGAVQVGQTSAATAITATNTGTLSLTIASVVASGDFAEMDDCVGTIAPGGTCTISATFAPTAAGPATGTIVLTDNATDSPQKVTLAGTGFQAGTPQASLSATTLSFADQEWGTPSQPQALTLTNVGTSALSISLTSIDGEGSLGFAREDGCRGVVLAFGASCSISVIFAPPETGSFSAVLSIADDAADSPQMVALSGNGVEPVSGGCSLTAAGGAGLPWGACLLLAVAALLGRRRSSRRPNEG